MNKVEDVLAPVDKDILNDTDVKRAHSAFISSIQDKCKDILSWEDANRLIKNPDTFTQDLACPNPDWFNVNGIVALLRMRRYELTHSPEDINGAASLILDSISLPDEPGYTHVSFWLASQSRDLFEEESTIASLARCIDLLIAFVDVQEVGTPLHFLGSSFLSSSFLLYALHDEDNDTSPNAIEAFVEAQTDLQDSTGSLLGERTCFMLGEILRHCYEHFGPGLDMNVFLAPLIRILNPFQSEELFCISTLEILSLSLLLNLAQSLETANLWYDVVSIMAQALDICVEYNNDSTVLATSMPVIASEQIVEPRMLSTLLDAVDQCPSTVISRTTCLSHLADLFKTKRDPPNQKSKSSNNLGSGYPNKLAFRNERQVEVSPANTEAVPRPFWIEEWTKARRCLRSALQLLGKTTSEYIQPGIHGFRQFRINAVPARRQPAFGRTLIRSPPAVKTHICAFKIDVVVSSISAEGELQENIESTPVTGPISPNSNATHFMFVRELYRLARSLSTKELNALIQHPNELILPGFPNAPELWRTSPGVSACLLAYKCISQFGKHSDLEQAGTALLSISLDREPGYEYTVFTLASRLRDRYEDSRDESSLTAAIELNKEFLRVQDKGGSRHWLAVTELSIDYAMYALHSGKGVAFRASTALLKEAMRPDTDLNDMSSAVWADARTSIVLGFLLHQRLRSRASTQESLKLSGTSIIEVLDRLPAQHPYQFSLLEVLTISLLLILAEDEDDWFDIMELLGQGLDLLLGDSRETADLNSVRLSGNQDCQLETATEEISAKRQKSAKILVDGLETIPLTLQNRAICLIHIADTLRCVESDVSRYPESLPLSTILCMKSLEAHDEQAYEGVNSSLNEAFAFGWQTVCDSMRRAILFCAQISTQPPFNSSQQSSSHAVTFQFRAFRSSLTQQSSGTIAHGCVFDYRLMPSNYHVRRSMIRLPAAAQVSSSDTAGSNAEPFDVGSSTAMPASVQSSDKIELPISSIYPGIERVFSSGWKDVYAGIPLNTTTIEAMMRVIESDTRTMERQLAQGTETQIHMSSMNIYWDPKEMMIENRLQKMKDQSALLARSGPLHALLSRSPERCLQLVEESRDLFWTRLLRLRVSFDGLPRDLAVKMKDVAEELDRCASQRSSHISREEIQRQYNLEDAFKKLLHQARLVNGFENFLQAKTYDMLMQAATRGPIVILLGRGSIYAALLVSSSSIEEMYLPSLNQEIMNTLLTGTGHANATSREAFTNNVEQERHIKPSSKISRGPPSYESILSQMWLFIAKPIIERLGLTRPEDPLKRRRLWWCPTGPFTFLPLHAAGTGYETGTTTCVSDYVISSYTPTLTALLDARSKVQSHLRISELRMLALAQPTTKGHPDLPQTAEELKVIEKQTPSNQLLRLQQSAESLLSTNANTTLGEVTAVLGQASVLHFACHGRQDQENPLNSGFQLTDGRLTLAELTKLRSPNAFFAFLSACESASSDQSIPDESLNLAAALLYVGFKSVIGTMWTMDDRDGPRVAETVYSALFAAQDQELDLEVIPYALDTAVRKLRQNGAHASRWATYIHMGI